LKVGLKYCGGCRAQYDRVGVVDAIRNRLGKEIEFVAADDEEAAMILVIAGCSTACVEIETGIGRPVRYVKSPEDAEQWIQEIKARASEKA
jgi:hypothetical protein